MKKYFFVLILPSLVIGILASGCAAPKSSSHSADVLSRIDCLGYETIDHHRVRLPATMLAEAKRQGSSQMKTPDGRTITLCIKPEANDYAVILSAEPDAGIIRWNMAVDASVKEYFTGLMERVVDGPQAKSWESNITAAMNLRGQKVDMILKPTTSVYAPFYISSGGYAVFVKGSWPGTFDFCLADPKRVQIAFEGPALTLKIYASQNPAALVAAHALDAGRPILPPRWMFTPWRWRDEHTQRTNYYDGTPVAGPFNSEFMEDVLLMKAYGIPCGVYWIDRPWGPGLWGYDDFKIDEQRLPNFAASVKWLEAQDIKTVLWIGPFFQGEMLTNSIKLGYTLAGQKCPADGNNYPMVDLTNPDAKKYWQDGVAKLLKLGVAGFKLDRAEEDIPEDGPYKVFDGRSIRENRNAYPPMYVKAVYDVARQYRGDDFVAMPRAAYTGSSAYGVFWGGDVGGTPEGLRASIIGVQRAAVMGYPNWGSDTCGYNQQSMDTDLCGRWLGFSCFTPIMEVGPTKNVAFWNFHNPPSYDATLIAIWRLYARLHTRLADYSFAQAKLAHETGMPIVRPLFLAEPQTPAAWSNWWTYLYGPDILVSPIWEKGRRTQEVYLPAGAQWHDAWNPDKIYNGGQAITVNAELHQVPVFLRIGSKVDLGDLRKEWKDAVAAADTRPDLKALDAAVAAWFARNQP
jgi:alpha-glucosidase (family GH31 glycosyl hydrolase)